ncbi:MAG TPA: hypothetical protein VD761_06700 [Solirubrobacterales bacterium]|nr:hypothetical protein [Solirubrobacterales bacterium]
MSVWTLRRCFGAPSLLLAGIVVFLALAPSARAEFGFLAGDAGFSFAATELDGSIDNQAGTHPYALTTSVAFKPGSEPAGPGEFFTDGDVRNLRIDRPAGLIENPTVVAQCSQALFNTPRQSPFQESLSGEHCPDDSQVGTIEVEAIRGSAAVTRRFGVFNLAPPPGYPAMLGASPFGVPVVFVSNVDSSGGEYRLSLDAANISQQLNLARLELSVWGNPWLVGHDRERGNCLNEVDPDAYFGTDAVLEREPQTKPPTPPYYTPGTCSVGDPKVHPPYAYLTMPASCRGPLVSIVTATAWQQPQTVVRNAQSQDEGGQPLPLAGCGPAGGETEDGTAVPTSDRTGSATGLDFSLVKDQKTLLWNFTPTGRLIPQIKAPSQVKRAVVTLPEGMTINPSLGAGLGSCSSAQYAAETATAPPGVGCPNNSKIGQMTIDSPLYAAPLEGGIYLAQPDDRRTPGAGTENPFDALLAVYLIAKASDRGVIVKLPGQVQLDERTGQIVTVFDGLPQLPYSKLDIRFRDGQRSPLASPRACRAYETTVDLSPWRDPSEVHRNRSVFELSRGIGGGPCPPALSPFAPQSQSGTLNRNAGAHTPFYLRLTRADTDQEITSYSAELPTGLLGNLTGVPYCPEASIAAAAANTGFGETERPSCPDASRIGRTVSGYGLGSVLAYAPGNLYLAGPYNGSSLSIVAVNSATVGPFDLGVIIVRSAIRIDSRTARVWIDSAGSDPIPHIMRGVPIHLRDIRVYIDRPNFTLNPTSCEPSSMQSVLTGAGASFADRADDPSVAVPSPFQVSFCSSLGFAPRIDFRHKGAVKRGAHPTLRTIVRPRPGDANIGRVIATLPPSEFLAQENIKTICGRAAYARRACPPESVYGWARAVTPLMAEPLEGPVVLRASDNSLPDLAAQIRGRGIDIDVVGRIDSVRGRLRVTYDVLPDAPVSRFELTIHGGKKRGLLVNSDNVCKAGPATVRMIGHNNVGVVRRPLLVNPICKQKKKNKKSAKKKGSRAKGEKRK